MDGGADRRRGAPVPAAPGATEDVVEVAATAA